jgi:SAM-dependent methyltransferase
MVGRARKEEDLARTNVERRSIRNRFVESSAGSPACQPLEIRAFLQAEIYLLDDLIADGMTVLDVGCGTGRHLAMLQDRLRLGVGVDYEHTYIVEARRRAGAHLHFRDYTAHNNEHYGNIVLCTCG